MSDLILRFQVELLEDLHTGSGEGRLGIVDDTQTCDAAGRWPVIRDSTLQGVLREAGDVWLQLRHLAADATVAEDRRLLNRLLGLPGTDTGLAIIRSLRLTPESKQQCARVGSPFIQWSATAREVHSRSPMNSTLHSLEFARAGLVFDGEIRIPDMVPQDSVQQARLRELLWQCLRRIPAIGGAKTRGWGAVRIRLLDELPQNEPLETPRYPVNATTGPVRLRMLLTNLEPLNLAATANPGNIIDCQSYLSGGRLRGALLTWLSSRGNVSLAEQLSDPSKMQIENAYPLPAEMAASEMWKSTVVVPMPLSIRQPKSTTSSNVPAQSVQQPWWAREEAGSDQFGAQQEQDEFSPGYDSGCNDERIKTEDYLASDPRKNSGRWRRVRSHRAIQMRNRVPTDRVDTSQSRSEVAVREDALFSYEVLPEGEHFIVDVWLADVCDAHSFAQAARELLDGKPATRSWLLVGRRRRPVLVANYTWNPSARPQTAESKVPNTFTLLLTSDLIFRSTWLGFLTNPALADWQRLLEAACRRFDITMPEGGLNSEALLLSRSRTEPTPIYSFNAGTGLFRSSALALRRGSVFEFRAVGDDLQPIALWRNLFQAIADAGFGLGERTAEGFGRILVDPDWQLSQSATIAAQTSLQVDWKESVLAELETCMSLVEKHTLKLSFSEMSNNPNGPENSFQITDSRGQHGLSISQWQWLRAQSASQGPDPALIQLSEHADRLAGRSWKRLPQMLQQHFAELGWNEEQKRFFVEALACSAVAALKLPMESCEEIKTP